MVPHLQEVHRIPRLHQSTAGRQPLDWNRAHSHSVRACHLLRTPSRAGLGEKRGFASGEYWYGAASPISSMRPGDSLSCFTLSLQYSNRSLQLQPQVSTRTKASQPASLASASQRLVAFQLLSARSCCDLKSHRIAAVPLLQSMQPQHWHRVKMGLVSGHTACNIGATRPATLQDRRRSAGVAAVVPPISRAGRGIGATSAPPPAGLVLLPRAGRGGGRAVIAQPLDRFRHCHHARSSSITVPYKPMRRYCCTAWI